MTEALVLHAVEIVQRSHCDISDQHVSLLITFRTVFFFLFKISAMYKMQLGDKSPFIVDLLVCY